MDSPPRGQRTTRWGLVAFGLSMGVAVAGIAVSMTPGFQDQNVAVALWVLAAMLLVASIGLVFESWVRSGWHRLVGRSYPPSRSLAGRDLERVMRRLSLHERTYVAIQSVYGDAEAASFAAEVAALLAQTGWNDANVPKTVIPPKPVSGVEITWRDERSPAGEALAESLTALGFHVTARSHQPGYVSILVGRRADDDPR